MGLSERRERERKARREAILAAAVQVARADGWREVTIRKITDRIEYAAPIVYEHFESKDALILELLRRGFQMMNERLTGALRSTAHPRTGIMKAAGAAMDFAAENPELYQVMHGLDGVPFGTPQAPVEAREAFATIRGALQSFERVERMRIANLDDLGETVWALIHGFVSLQMAHRLPGGIKRVKPLMLRALESVLEGTRGGRMSLRRRSETTKSRKIRSTRGARGK